MPAKDPQYRILDKDLGRLSNAEHARVASAQPLLRLGIALIFIVALTTVATTVLSSQPNWGMMAAAVAIAIYLALTIGSNDLANSLSPAVGAGAITLVKGLMLITVVEVLGAVVGGGPVTRTLTQDLIGDGYATGEETAHMMLAALTGAATCIGIATWLNAPVSTTHSVVGAIAGAGIATIGLGAVHWPAMAMVALGWVLSPVVSGLLAAGLLASMHRSMLDKRNPIRAGRVWLTLVMAVTAALLVVIGAIAWGQPHWWVVAALGLGAALAVAAYTYHLLGRKIARGERGDRDGIALKSLLGLPLIIAALIMGFGHGANSSAKIAGPLMVVLNSLGPRDGAGPAHLPLDVVLLFTGIGIAVGMILFGGRLVQMVGARITQLNHARALCITLASAMTVLFFSLLGLPVSTTHITVGGVFGVGVYRELRDRRKTKTRAPLPSEEIERRQFVRWSYVRRILGAWIVTVPTNAAVAAVLALLIQG